MHSDTHDICTFYLYKSHMQSHAHTIDEQIFIQIHIHDICTFYLYKSRMQSHAHTIDDKAKNSRNKKYRRKTSQLRWHSQQPQMETSSTDFINYWQYQLFLFLMVSEQFSTSYFLWASWVQNSCVKFGQRWSASLYLEWSPCSHVFY